MEARRGGRDAGAAECLTKAAPAGTVRLPRKVAEAVALGKLHGDVDEALAAAAAAGRLGEGDLASILAHRGEQVIELPRARASRPRCQRSTRSRERFGR